jgi:FKBP-type peptidyl-prolyl cis-trans isomerase FkpA
MRPVRRLLPALLALALTSPLAACNSDTTTAPAEVSTGNPLTETFAPALGVNIAGSQRTLNGVYYRVTAEPTGTGVPVTAAVGKQVTVEYTGWLWNGRKFDAGTIPFTLGTTNIIPGWNEGIVGMRVGEKRQLVIPPSLAYGANGYGPIPPNAVLVFDVRLLAVN